VNKLKIVKGDVFASIPPNNDKKILIPHCVNDIGAWGSGFVLAINKFSMKPKEEYVNWNDYNSCGSMYNDTICSDSDRKFYLGACQIVNCDNNVYVANMVGQHETVRTNSKPVRYWALAEAMRYIARKHLMSKHVNVCNSQCMPIDEIRTVRFGSGLAQGNAAFIEELMKEIWVDIGIPVTVYEL